VCIIVRSSKLMLVYDDTETTEKLTIHVKLNIIIQQVKIILMIFLPKETI